MNKILKLQDYTMTLGSDLLSKITENIPQDLHSHQFVVMTDERVNELYGEEILNALRNQHFKAELLTFPGGEAYKNRDTKAQLESALLKKGYGRDTCLIALGGGVVGDLVGFVAATYLRGIPYIQVPTTLLAMIDSSVGGKTAINTPEGKNLIGAFWNPRAVIADLNCLMTLPQTQKINGWFEALKIFLILDSDSFNEAIKSTEPNLSLIARAVELKAQIVSKDPHETGLRAVLNFGHTLGHALEKISDYELLHGYAVAYGILIESQISLQRGLINPEEYQLIQRSFESLGLETQQLSAYTPESLFQAIRNDKKSKQQQTRMVLLSGLGAVHTLQDQYTHVVSDHEISQAIHTLNTGADDAR